MTVVYSLACDCACSDGPIGMKISLDIQTFSTPCQDTANDTFRFEINNNCCHFFLKQYVGHWPEATWAWSANSFSVGLSSPNERWKFINLLKFRKKRMQVNLSFLLYLFFLRVWRIRAALDKVWVRKTPVCFCWSIFPTFHDHLMNLQSMVPHVLCSIKISWTLRKVTISASDKVTHVVTENYTDTKGKKSWKIQFLDGFRTIFFI